MTAGDTFCAASREIPNQIGPLGVYMLMVDNEQRPMKGPPTGEVPDREGQVVSPAFGGRSIDKGPEAVFIASFAEFYDIHHGKIATSLALTFGDVELGREAADEAMTRAFSHWGTVSGHRNPAGWVYRVGLNWGRSWFRRAGRRLPWLEDTSTDLPQTEDPALRKALLRLDYKYRSIVVCRYFLDWSTQQTAEALDIPLGTAKSRLHHALAQLQVDLQPHPAPGGQPPGVEE